MELREKIASLKQLAQSLRELANSPNVKQASETGQELNNLETIYYQVQLQNYLSILGEDNGY